jgi:hypothetical protein
MILLQSLKEKLDRESYVSRLIDLTRTLCHEPKPTAETLKAIDLQIDWYLQRVWSDDNPRLPFSEEVAWVDPFIEYMLRCRKAGLDTTKLLCIGSIYMVLGHLGSKLNSPFAYVVNLFSMCFQKIKYDISIEVLQAFKHMAYKPEERHAPDGSLLRIEYDKLEKELLGEKPHPESAGVAHPVNALPTKERVFEAVAKCYKDNIKNGLLRPEAVKKAIADNIDDVRALDLWRTNKGRPNEGDPGSSWQACYQALYSKGRINRQK